MWPSPAVCCSNYHNFFVSLREAETKASLKFDISSSVLFHLLECLLLLVGSRNNGWLEICLGVFAALAYKGKTFGSKEAKITLGTNFFGTMQTCEALLPMMSTSGRIVNVCR